MEGFVKEYPPQWTEIYIYNPINLHSGICVYTVEKYIPTAYHNKKIDSGLCYYDLKSIQKRICNEKSRLSMMKHDL